MFRGMSDYARGLAITALGVLIITPDALLLRLISADHWTVLVWRGLGFLLVQAMIVLARHGRGSAAALRRTGMDGLLVFVLFSLSQCLFVHSITHTTVANTLVIIAAAPLMAALFAWLMLRERVERRTLVAGFIGLGAVALTLSTSIGHGRLDGDLSALATMLLLALLFTLLRRAKDRDMLPAVAASGLGTMLIALTMADTVIPPAADWLWLALVALFVSPVSFALISIGPRYLPAPEVGLLMLLETALGPLWVWLVLAERPDTLTLAGGGILLSTLIANGALGMIGRRRHFR